MSSYEDLPEKWTVTAIDEILADLGDGKKLHQGWSPQCEKGPCSSAVDWGVLKTTAIQAGRFEPQHHKRLPDHLEPKHAIEVRPGDMVITCAGPRIRCGIACLVRATRPRLLLSGKMYRFRFPPQIDARYMEAYLQSEDARLAIDAMKTGGNESGLNLTHDRFRRLSVPIAPTAEQFRIADKLEELLTDLDAGVAELRAAQKKLAQYRQSLLKAAVEGALTAGWRDNQRKARAECGEEPETGARLLERILAERRRRWEEKQLAKFKEQGTPPKDWQSKYPEPFNVRESLPPTPDSWTWTTLDSIIGYGPQNGLYLPAAYYGDGLPILRIEDFQQHWLRPIDQWKRVRVESSVGAPYVLRQGDLVVNRVNSLTHLGKSLSVSCAIAGALFESNMMRMSFVSQVRSRFVQLYLQSKPGNERLIENAKWAVNQASINQTDVRKTEIPLPPADEQIQICERIDELTSLINAHELATDSALKQAAAQRQNILKAAFSGKLVPQDPNDEPASALLERIRAERAAREQNGKRGARKSPSVPERQKQEQSAVRLEENELTQ